MQVLREGDARRAGTGRRDRVVRAHAAAPLVAAVVVIGGAAVLASAADLPIGAVVAVTLVVAVAGAVVARRDVASMAAGLTLLVVRPYEPGERLRFHSPAHGRVIEAEVVRIGLANTTLAIRTGLLVVPNARLLRGSPAPHEQCDCTETSVQA